MNLGAVRARLADLQKRQRRRQDASWPAARNERPLCHAAL